MRVFVTGATGKIGSAVVKELVGAGHQVLGLCRSKSKEAALVAAGAQPHAGSLDDPDSLRSGVAASDGVIHLAFNHDFSTFAANCEADRRVIETLGAALAGTDRPLIVTSGTAIANAVPGEPAREDNPTIDPREHPRAISEQAAAAVQSRGVNISVVRLPQVHDAVRQGLISYAIATFRDKGICGYVNEGRNRWPAAHVSDVARLYRLAIERAEPGARYHAVAEEGVAMRDIVEAVARRLRLPVKSVPAREAQDFFGWLAMFASQDMPASSAQTRRVLGWQPTGPGLIEDLARLELPSP